MIQKKRYAAARRCRFLWGMMTAVGIVSALWCRSFVSLADAAGTVKVDSVVIREKADKGSSAIGSASRGAEVAIRDEVQDSSGALWYQVYVDTDTTGYIRADLIEKKDGGADAQSDNGSDSQRQDADAGGSRAASGAAVQAGSAMDAQYATVSVETLRVRTAPSTNDAVVDRLAKNAQVIVSGQSDGTDGKVWYFVTFTGTSGVERTGFIRSDLLSLGDMVPVPEEEEPEQPAETPAPVTQQVNDDYELSYDQEKDGTYAWYVHDNVAGYKQKLQPLLDAAQAQEEDASDDAKTLVRQRIVIVVLIALAVLLIVAVIIMALKLRDVYYEDYEDEDGQEEDDVSQRRRSGGEDETPVRRRSREEEPEVPSQRRRSGGEDGTPAQRRRRAEEGDETSVRRRRRMEEEEAETARRRTVRESDDRDESASARKRKTKNFLLDDDEFEFEFLSMEDRNT